nr:TIGR02996 domain-containing protein [Kofleriaceae bacterium]
MAAALGTLDRALAAVRANDLRAALVDLLAAWRASLDVRIADAIDALSPLAAAEVRAPTDDAEWTRAASQRDPVMRHWLIVTLADVDGRGALVARARRLASDAPDDPRVASALCDLVAAPRVRVPESRSDTSWQQLFALLAHLRDPRVVDRARAFPEAWLRAGLRRGDHHVLSGHLAAAMPAIAAAHDAMVDDEDTGERAADPRARDALVADLAGELADIPASAATAFELGLLSAVYGAPADDAPRQVYADWLLDRGDPRGEFIALQLADRDPDRQRALIAAHGSRWLSPFGRSVLGRGARFARGFPDTLAATAIDNNRAWSTVRVAIGAVPEGDDWHLASLRELRYVRGPHIHQLAMLARPLPVTDVDWMTPFRGDVIADDDRAAFGAIVVLPELQSLVVRAVWPQAVVPEELAWLWTARWARALADVTLRVPIARLAMWHDAFSPTRLARVTLWGTSDSNGDLRGGIGYGFCAALSRDATGALSRLAMTWPTIPSDNPEYGAEAMAGLASLQRGQLTALTIAVPPTRFRTAGLQLRGELARLADRLDVELSLSLGIGN